MKKNHITANIKFLRQYSGCSQIDFAKLFEVSRDNIASYERGSEPRISFLNDLVNYFHITFEDLINNELNQTFFETKCAQKVINGNDDKDDDLFDDKRNVLKRSSSRDSNVNSTSIDERDPRDAEIIELLKKHNASLEQQIAMMAEQISDLKKGILDPYPCFGTGVVFSEDLPPAAPYAVARPDNPKRDDNTRLNRP